MTPNIRGALLMMGSMALFTINDVCMKTLAGDVPLVQSVFLRGVVTVPMMLALARVMGVTRVAIAPRDRWLILLRNVTEVATAYLFLTALFNMPIANASAIMQALPLTITLAGAVFLGQAVGWRRMSAIVVGFAGVMLIVRPGMDGFTIYSLYVVGAVLMVTVRDILSRMISGDVPSLTIALSNAVSVTLVFGIASIFGEWEPLGGPEVAAIGAAAVFIIGAYVCAVATMRAGDVAAIAPFRYTSLLTAMILGLVVFGEVPDWPTLAGSFIVVATGLYTFWREARLARETKGRSAA